MGFIGHSGSGKTTLIEQLIARLVADGMKVSLIKHAHHGFDIDRPGKDSYRHREAGGSEVLVISDKRWVLMHELREEPEPSLFEQLALLSPCDIVLVEGFKNADIPKIEVHRKERGGELLCHRCPQVIAVATDEPALSEMSDAPECLDLNDPEQIVKFLLYHLEFKPTRAQCRSGEMNDSRAVTKLF